MRILELHCDYVRFKPRDKALKSAPALTAAEKEGVKIEDVLLVLTSFEKGDDEAVVKKAAAAVEKNIKEIKAPRILVYPYAHLSSDLCSPDVAQRLLKAFADECSAFAQTSQAPFGYYKEFELKCKGHPMAELSKTISAELGVGEKKEDATPEALKKEASVKSRFYILTPDGEVHDAGQFNYGNHANLKKFADYEIRKVRSYATEPPHIALMREHHIAGYEPGSDAGNFRWLPNGRLMKKLIERDITAYCTGYGAMEVETPLMYDYQHPSLKKYLTRFPARQYVVKSDEKEFFLRFAACFGQFLIAHDMTISYKNLPMKMFELTRYSFRREQSGELAGLKRVRAMTMPDMHTFTKDLDGAKQEFESQFRLSFDWLSSLKLPFEAGFRSQKDFFEENRDWYVSLAKHLGKPVLLEIFDERYAYFITKFEFNFVDCLDKASALSTVQIDVENADTYDISYVDEDGSKKRPVLMHASISGSVERVIYALLENEARKISEGKTPSFPTWLSPTQVRIVPVSEKNNAYCEKVLAAVRDSGVRADFDDRQETLQKKIRDAGTDWVPFVAVVGDKEEASGKMNVRVRATGENEMLTPDELAALVRNECRNKPFEPLTLPDHLTKRAGFA
ncbi:MAG: threonine--tRNA ligase [Candidatus Micrarchaeota archaeon]